jgi:S-adenosylmethionine-dependent methyltransferase
MKDPTLKDDTDRFRTGAAKYAAYLDTLEGRLRTDLAFANLQEFLPRTLPLRVLDLGCGTGAIAVRLAQMGLNVTLLDESLPMLDIAQHAAREAGVEGKVTLQHGDACQLASLFPSDSFDVILCHNILEYVEAPGLVLRTATRALRNTSSILSLLTRNQLGEVLKAAIKDGDLAVAERSITSEWGYESLYGGTVRLFSSANLRDLLTGASLEAEAVRGVRVVSDYLPAESSGNNEYEHILDLELKLGGLPEFAAIARYTQCLVRRAGTATKDGA